MKKPHQTLSVHMCRKYILRIWLAVLSAGLVLLGLIHFGIAPECIIYNLTGFLCGGCGTTRMFISLLCGNISVAFRQNIASFIFIPFLIIYSILCFIGHPEFLRRRTTIYKVVFGTLLIWFLFGILRNFTFFSYLAPII